MTAEQAIRREILISIRDDNDGPPLDTGEKIDASYEATKESEDADFLGETESDFRSTFTCQTDIECESSRHYESKSVARKLSDGTWVGWTYWYGGGKHGEPGAVPWMEDAYFIDVTEEEKVVIVRTFTKPVCDAVQADMPPPIGHDPSVPTPQGIIYHKET